MKTFKSIFILSMVSLLIFGFTSSELPKSWFRSGSKSQSYKVDTDSITFQSGKKSVCIASLDSTIEGFETVMQYCSAKNYLGTRIKMTGYIKSENVAQWACLLYTSPSPRDGL